MSKERQKILANRKDNKCKCRDNADEETVKNLPARVRNIAYV